MVTRKILDVVLSFSVRVIGGLSQNAHAFASANVLPMRIDVFHPDHERGFQRHVFVPFDQDDCAISGVQLRSMMSHANAQGEAKGIAQAMNGFLNVGIGELRQYSASGHGAVHQHEGDCTPPELLVST